MQQSLAEKALFSTLPGKLTKKTLAMVSILVVGRRSPGVGTPRFLLYASRDFPTLEILEFCRFSMTDFRVSR